jgi:Methyltransferase FkbM domain
MKPRLAPLAAGCMAESGSRLPHSKDFVGKLVLMRVYFWPSPLVEKHRIKVIDLLQIDTEGFDFEVIKMVDFDCLPPAIIHYDHCHLGKANAEASFRFLIERGYRVSVGETDTIALKAKRSA